MAAASAPLPLDAVLARGDVWRGDALAALPGAAISSGYPELDAELPGGGWPRGCLTEFLVDRDGLGEISLLLPALARLSGEGGWLALVAPPWLPHAPAWAAAGLVPERLLVVRAGRHAAWCLEQLLACGGFAGVLAWPGADIDARALRRLQVAAEGRPVFAGLWRSTATGTAPSPAPLRVALAADATGLSVRLLKRRGRPASRTLRLGVPRPGRNSRVVAGPSFAEAAAGSAAATAAA
ncbi:MAG: translesion DNA synthesis-associated protein ImuA [Betaproteobacteria bacterium]|nr:translesion DNA synthesis-associated protein ImuA [Betaproteobacteria bacterium]